MCLRCEDRPLTKREKEQAELYKALNWSLLYGAQGYGKNYAAASKVRERMWALRNGEVNHSLPEMPKKICNYRKPKVHWFGELHGSNNFVHNASMRASHWAVTRGKVQHLQLEDFFRDLGDDIETYQSKRFIGISEPIEDTGFDEKFLMRFTGDDWTETKPMDRTTGRWKPQGEIFVMSGKPLKINDKSKETIERVKDITFP